MRIIQPRRYQSESLKPGDEAAFRIWVRFSMADKLQEASQGYGRRGIDPVWRWVIRVPELIKNQFRAEADGHPIPKFPSRHN